MTPSLRIRLLAGTVGGMVLLLMCFGLIVYAAMRRALFAEFDRSLESTAAIMAAAVEVDANDIEIEFEVHQTPEVADAERSALYQIWGPEGEVVAKSPLLGERDLPWFHGPVGTPVHRAFSDPCDHRPHRAVSLRFLPRIEAGTPADPLVDASQQTLILAVARDARALHDRLNFLKWLLLHAAGVTTALTLLVGNAVVRSGLRPLESIAAEIAALDEESLDARVGSDLTPAEIQPVRERLNNLLARLRTAFERERRFGANVAHELRNPLAGMRATIEVTLARNRDDDEYRRALRECLAIIDDIQAMVNNLLLLARMDAGQMAFRMEPVVLAELVDTSWKPLSTRATERRLTFENCVAPDMTMTCDRSSLLVVFSNLLDNAVEYTDPGGRIGVQAREEGACVQIVVANTGCRLDPDQTGRVFDRFWRADTARSDAGTHCGLGLSLVHRIARALGGSAGASVENGTFTLRLRLPRAGSGADLDICEQP